MVRWIKLFGNQYLGFWILGLVLFALQEIPYMIEVSLEAKITILHGKLHLKGIETGKEAAIHMADLSYNYASGEGVTRDYHEALKWARASLDASGLDLSTANWAADMEKQLENLILS